MEGGDISNAATPRVWVMEEVVLSREYALVVSEQPVKKHWWSRKKVEKAASSVPLSITIDRAAMSLLWRYSQRMQATGIRIELVHIGDDSVADDIMALLDTHSSNVFSNVLVFSSTEELVDALPYRSDVISVVDEGRKALRFGSRGTDFAELL